MVKNHMNVRQSVALVLGLAAIAFVLPFPPYSLSSGLIGGEVSRHVPAEPRSVHHLSWRALIPVGKAGIIRPEKVCALSSADQSDCLRNSRSGVRIPQGVFLLNFVGKREGTPVPMNSPPLMA